MHPTLRTALVLGGGTLVGLWVVRRLTGKPNQLPPGTPNPLNVDPNNLPPTYVTPPSGLPGGQIPGPAPGFTPVLPPSAYQPPPVPAPVVQGPRGQLSELSVLPGRSYRAVVVVHAPLSWLATVDKVRREAEKQGFQNVVVQTSRPQGFPGNATGDYYVYAVYGGAPQTMSRSNAKGQVEIVDAWEV